MEEFISLTKDMQKWIQKQGESSSYFEHNEEKIFLQQSIKPIPEVKALPKNVMPLSKVEEKKSSPEIPSVKSAPLETTRLDEMKQLFKKHSQSQFREDLPSFIKLITTNKDSLAFLQKLEHAISTTFLPAKAFFANDEKEMKNLIRSAKLLLAPLSEMPSTLKVEHANIHELVKVETFYWMPLHPCSHYLKDPGLKHSLWNSLKSLNFADLLA